MTDTREAVARLEAALAYADETGGVGLSVQAADLRAILSALHPQVVGVAEGWQTDDCRAVGDWSEDQVEQLMFELSWELEEAALNVNDYVTVNREKLRTIAKRVLARLAAAPKPTTEPTIPEGPWLPKSGGAIQSDNAGQAYGLATDPKAAVEAERERVLQTLWRNIDDGDSRMARENVACLGFLLREGRLPKWEELESAFAAIRTATQEDR